MSIALLEAPSTRQSKWIDPESQFEIIDGIEVDVAPMSVYSAEVGNQIFRKLSVYLERKEIGEAQHETLFHLNLPKDRNRIPDVSFVSYERWPKNRPFPYRGNARNVIPDLVVEVVSPGDTVEELTTKVEEYFRAGVRMIWVVLCNLHQIYLYRSLTSLKVLTADTDLDGGDVLPGFLVPVASLFPLSETPTSNPIPNGNS